MFLSYSIKDLNSKELLFEAFQSPKINFCKYQQGVFKYCGETDAKETHSLNIFFILFSMNSSTLILQGTREIIVMFLNAGTITKYMCVSHFVRKVGGKERNRR